MPLVPQLGSLGCVLEWKGALPSWPVVPATKITQLMKLKVSYHLKGDSTTLTWDVPPSIIQWLLQCLVLGLYLHPVNFFILLGPMYLNHDFKLKFDRLSPIPTNTSSLWQWNYHGLSGLLGSDRNTCCQSTETLCVARIQTRSDDVDQT